MWTARLHRARACSCDFGAVGLVDAELVVLEGDGPAGLVHDRVVVVAEQHQIVEIGRPVVLPVDDVMGITPSAGLSTPRISTALVSDDQPPALSRRHGAGVTADI